MSTISIKFWRENVPFTRYLRHISPILHLLSPYLISYNLISRHLVSHNRLHNIDCTNPLSFST